MEEVSAADFINNLVSGTVLEGSDFVKRAISGTVEDKDKKDDESID